jgi:exopolysaccharide biosynthesis polyprenyl glycosylphosphotransferase
VSTAIRRPPAVLDLRDAPQNVPVQRHRLRRTAFAAAAALAAGAVGVSCLVLAYTLGPGLVHEPFEPYRPVVYFAGLVRALLFLVGRHDANRRRRGVLEEAVIAAREAALGSCALVIFTFFWRDGTRFRAFSYSRELFLLDLVFACVGLTVAAVASKRTLHLLRRRGHDLRTVVVVGTPTSSEAFLAAVADHPETGYVVQCLLDPLVFEGPALLDQLNYTAASSVVHEIVITAPVFDRDDLARLVGLGRLRRVELRAVPDFLGLPPSKVDLEPLLDFPLLSLLRDPRSRERRQVSRVIDLVVGTVALAVTSPIMLLAALLVKLTSSGPVLFRQERMGMDGRPFTLLKFRTMYDKADTAAHEAYVESLIQGAEDTHDGLYKLVHDPRITPVGRVLRRLSVDELPQLFNVVRGDMSLVGPRPALANEVAVYQPWMRRRLDVRPGLTGLWQVSGRSRTSFEDMVRLDIQYIEQWSPLEDCRILLRTIPAVLRRESS